VLGSVVRHLHSRPLLTRAMIQDTVSDPAYSYLATSNLADAVDFVRFSPLSLSLEELSKLWSIFFQTPYALSAAYRASMVFIEEELAAVTPLPVRERQIFVVPFQQPFIENVDPKIIGSGATLTLLGQNLRGDVTKIKFGDTLATPATVNNQQITVALPPACHLCDVPDHCPGLCPATSWDTHGLGPDDAHGNGRSEAIAHRTRAPAGHGCAGPAGGAIVDATEGAGSPRRPTPAGSLPRSRAPCRSPSGPT